MDRMAKLVVLPEFQLLPTHKKSYLITFVHMAGKQTPAEFEMSIMNAESEMRKLRVDYSDLMEILRKVNTAKELK